MVLWSVRKNIDKKDGWKVDRKKSITLILRQEVKERSRDGYKKHILKTTKSHS